MSEQKDSSEREAFVTSAIALTHLFSTCVECFGLIHPGKNWNRDQQLLLTKLGIQQAKLLIWGDNLGVCALGIDRDARLDEPSYRSQIETQLHSIIDRPAHTDRATQFEKFGLKPPKRFTSAYEPALDFNRMEAFREKYIAMRTHDWHVKRGMSITASHWTIVDNERFENFLDVITNSVTALIALFGNEERVERAVKHDIRALGYHPIFNKYKASKDTGKLRLIRDAHPEYADVADEALAYLEKEYQDDYTDGRADARRDSLGWTEMERHEQAAAAATAASNLSPPQSPKHNRRSSLQNLFATWRPKSWRKDKTGSRSNSIDAKIAPAASRSKSESGPAAATNATLTPPRTPERSKSVGVVNGIAALNLEESVSPGELSELVPPEEAPVPVSPKEPVMEETNAEAKPEAEEEKDELEELKQVPTTSSGGKDLEQVKSMISRHDQWHAPVIGNM